MRLLYFGRGFKSYGPQLIMLWRMIVSLLATSWLAVFLIASCAHVLFILHGAREPSGEGSTPFSSVPGALWTCFLTLFGLIDVPWEEASHVELGLYAQSVVVTFVLVGSLLYINLLVAIMTSSYEKVSVAPSRRTSLRSQRGEASSTCRIRTGLGRRGRDGRVAGGAHALGRCAQHACPVDGGRGGVYG